MSFNELHSLVNGSGLDLVLIFLAFFAGRAIEYKESLYLLIFLLKLGSWVIRRVPRAERKNLEASLNKLMIHIMTHHPSALKHDSQVGGAG